MTGASDDVKPRIRRTHLALYVKNPFETAAWYKDVLNMIETARGTQWVFLSFGRKHHDIALIQADPDTLPPAGFDPRGPINMQHYGLEIEGDMDDLRRLYGMLLRKNIPIVKITDHKVGIGLYFTDPDGHRFEFFLETVHGDEEGRDVLGQYNAPSEPFTLTPL